MTTTMRPEDEPLHIRGRTRLRVQLQFDRHGDRAADVSDWIEGHYPHVGWRVAAQPGLTVSVDVPCPDTEGFSSWHARLAAGLSPVDVAMELLALCFDDLDLEPAQLVSMHMTDA